jgi:hypothetical protein
VVSGLDTLLHPRPDVTYSQLYPQRFLAAAIEDPRTTSSSQGISRSSSAASLACRLSFCHECNDREGADRQVLLCCLSRKGSLARWCSLEGTLQRLVVIFSLIPPKKLVMGDLIQNAHTLFDERPSPSPQSIMGSTTRHRPGLVYDIPTSTHWQSSSSSLPLDAAMESRSPASLLLSPLLGLPSSKTLPEGVEMTAQEKVIPEVRGTEAVETLTKSTLAEVVSVPTSVAQWRLEVQVPPSQLPPHPEAMTIPQSPSDSESVLSSTSGFPLSSATSLRTRMGPFFP